MLEIDVKIVNSINSAGTLLLTYETVLVETSKSITEIEYGEEKITLPFSV